LGAAVRGIGTGRGCWLGAERGAGAPTSAAISGETWVTRCAIGRRVNSE
jgi:hypothetical protein